MSFFLFISVQIWLGSDVNYIPFSFHKGVEVNTKDIIKQKTL